METVISFGELIKDVLCKNSWLWQVFQVILLIEFFPTNKPFYYAFAKTRINNKIRGIWNYILTLILLGFLFANELISIIVFISFFIWETVGKFKQLFFYSERYIKIHLAFGLIRCIVKILIISSLGEVVGINSKTLLIIIWLYELYLNLIIVLNTLKYLNKTNQKKLEEFQTDSFTLCFHPTIFLMSLIDNSWYIWLFLLIFISFVVEKVGSPFPKFFIKSDKILIDDVNKIIIGKLDVWISACVLILFGFSLYTFLFLGIFYYSAAIAQSSRRKFNDGFNKYSSFSFVLGNYNLLEQIRKKGHFMRLLQRINFNKYCVLLSPYRYLIVGHKKIIPVDDITHKSNHLILIDDGNSSDKLITLEKEFNKFLSRVDTVIDYYIFDHPEIDIYSKAIDANYADCIRERIEIKQSVADEKPLVFDSKLETKKIDIDKNMEDLFNSISAESVRINLNIKEYFEEANIDYLELQNELISNGYFEINTLLRQMREGESVPSRFIDALSIAEVSSRFIFGLLNEVSIGLKKNDINAAEERNKRYNKMSFGPCIGFLRNLISKKKKNQFEKDIANILKTKYTDQVNYHRLKIYLISNLNYEENLSDNPTLFDLLSYVCYIRNKTRGHGTPSKVEFDFYVTLDLISIFITHCISKIDVQTFTRQSINDKEWMLYYNLGGNLIINPINEVKDYEFWQNTIDWDYRSTIERVKKEILISDDKVYFNINLNGERILIQSQNYFKCKEGVIYMYDGYNNGEADWISFTTGSVIRPNRLN
jgi:hypothetical protein